MNNKTLEFTYVAISRNDDGFFALFCSLCQNTTLQQILLCWMGREMFHDGPDRLAPKYDVFKGGLLSLCLPGGDQARLRNRGGSRSSLFLLDQQQGEEDC